MTKTIYIAAAAVLLTIAPFVEANAFSRSGTFVSPRGGTTTWQSQRSCSGGTCTGSRTVTGPADAHMGRHADVLGRQLHLTRQLYRPRRQYLDA